MSQNSQSLREPHRILRQLADLRERLGRGPRQMAVAETTVKKLEELLAKSQQAVKQNKMAADQKQLQLRSNEDRISDLKGKQNAAASNREYQAFKEQIAASEMANSVLADEILEALEKVDQAEAVVAGCKADLEKGKDELQKVRSRVDEERQLLEGDVARLQAELKKAEDLLPEPFKADYTRIVKARGEEALAPVEGTNCSGCNQTITFQMKDSMIVGTKPTICRNCGRLLYLAEER